MEDELRDVDAWRGAVSKALLRFEVQCARPDRFRGTTRRHALGDTVLIAMTCRPHVAVRTTELIDDGPADYLLSLQLAGSAEFRQDGRRARTRPGDLVFYDTSRPVEIVSGEGYRSLCFRFPTAGPGAHRRAEALTATALTGAHGLTPALAGLLVGLHDGLDRIGGRPRTIAAAAHHAAELARVLFDDELARRGLLDVPDAHVELRDRIDRHIEDNLADPGLSARTIAAALFMSSRHLHALLAEDDRTVAGTIRALRLRRCLADLADPSYATLPVSAVAARHGLTNPTHFGQMVKQATGYTPSAYRRAMLDDGTG